MNRLMAGQTISTLKHRHMAGKPYAQYVVLGGMTGRASRRGEIMPHTIPKRRRWKPDIRESTGGRMKATMTRLRLLVTSLTFEDWDANILLPEIPAGRNRNVVPIRLIC